MIPAFLLIFAWLGNSPDATNGTSQQTPRRGVLDVVVFYADAPKDLDRYPAQVREELRQFMDRARAYRPRPRPARVGSERQMDYNAREGYEGKLAAAASVASASRLAQQYVDALRPCYEWEGFHDCPEREAVFAEQHLRDRPDTPFRDVLRLLTAHRWLCTSEAYEYEKKPAEARRARASYEEALKLASASRSLLMTVAAGELETSGRCYATDPFLKRN